MIAGAGFLLVLLSDLLQTRKATAFSAFLSWTGYALVALCVASLALRGLRATADALAIAGLALSAVFSGLLLFSVCFEIPFAKNGAGAPKNKAYAKGTYGFSRHPGFLWFAALQCALWPVHRDGGSLWLSAWMILLDFLLICLEDRFLFPRIFVDYREYRKKVPFLLPLPGLKK